MIARLLFILSLIITVLSSVGLIACYMHAGVLSIENASYLATIGGSVVGAVSLIFIAIQLNQQTKLTRAGNSLSFVNLSSDFTSKIINDDALITIWYAGNTFATFTDVQKLKYKQLIDWWLTFYDNVIYQHKCGLLDEDAYNAWITDMELFIQKRLLATVWNDLKGSYGAEFVQRINKMLPAPSTTCPL